MARQYRIIKSDGPRDEYEATIIPYKYTVQVKGWYRWHNVKTYADFDEDWCQRRAEELVGHLEDSGAPVDLPGEKEARDKLRAEYVAEIHVTIDQQMAIDMHNRSLTGNVL